MPRTLPTGLNSVINGVMDVYSTIRLKIRPVSAIYTNAPDVYFNLATSALTIDGNVYRARLMGDNAISLLRQSLGGAIDRAEVSINDADGALWQELQPYQEALQGAQIELGRCWVNTSTGQQFHKILMRGIVGEPRLTPRAINLSVTAESYASGAIGGARVVARKCQWQFKSRECGYTGVLPTCDKLYASADGCAGRSRQHAYGGFIQIKGLDAVAGAAGNATPPTSTNIPTTVINVKTDKNAVGDGVADDTAALQAALDEAATAGGGCVWIPKGTYLVTGLTLTGNVTLRGFNDKESVIVSATNAPIITTASDGNFEMPRIESLRIRGSVTAGASQTGLRMDAATYGLRAVVRDVWIENCGGAGLHVLKAFSSIFENVFATNCAGYPFLIDSTNMPANTFRSCYAGNLRASATVGFRVKAGEAIFYNCNGINSVPTGAKWAVVGKKNGVDGDTTDAGAVLSLYDCNVESFDTHGILAYHASTLNVRGFTTFAGNGNPNQKAIEFDLAGDGTAYFAQAIRRGIIDDTVNFADGLSAYLNSQPIHANGFAPLMAEARGPATGGGNPLTTYRNNIAGASRILSTAAAGFIDDPDNGRALSKRRIALPDGGVTAPGLAFENEYGAGITRLASRVMAFTIPTTAGGDGAEVMRLDGSSGASYLFMSRPFLFLTDATHDIGQSGANRPRHVYISGDMWASRFILPNGRVITGGNGSPEGVVTAPQGSQYLRQDGGAGTTLYVKESGSGNTGWVAK